MVSTGLMNYSSSAQDRHVGNIIYLNDIRVLQRELSNLHLRLLQLLYHHRTIRAITFDDGAIHIVSAGACA